MQGFRVSLRSLGLFGIWSLALLSVPRHLPSQVVATWTVCQDADFVGRRLGFLLDALVRRPSTSALGSS